MYVCMQGPVCMNMYMYMCMNAVESAHVHTHTCTYNIISYHMSILFHSTLWINQGCVWCGGDDLIAVLTRTSLNPVVTRVCVCHHT